MQHSPVVLHHLEKRAGDWQLRLTDWVTNVAGSMPFVRVQVATFLSAVEMIGQDRQTSFPQATADHDCRAGVTESVITARLTRPVRRMTKEIRAMARDAGLAGDKLLSPRSVGNQWLAS